MAVAAEHRVVREGCGELFDRKVEEPAAETVDDQQQADEDADGRENGGVGEGAHEDALDGDAGGEGGDDRQREGDPVGKAGVDEGQRDVGGEGCHLALGEIHVVSGLVDHDQGEGDGGVDAAGGNARHDLVENAG
jgi:hypothetical protein